MDKLEKLSKIGVGTYRMSVENAAHRKNIKYAIDKGITLFDTASNYVNGNSEKLIGSIGSEYRKKIFIITKAGYVQNANFEILKSLTTKIRHIHIKDGFYYCIDPRYLEAQITESLKRLRTDFIDCFLIHNPEYYYKIYPDSEKVYQDMVKAFQFLEQLKQKGIIRYFGLSSNTLPNPNLNNGIDLRKIDPQKYKGFKFIQFPYNLVEMGASENNYDKESLITLAKSRGLNLLSNRPFNAQLKNKFIRLVDFNQSINLDELEKRDYDLFPNLIESLSDRITKIDSTAAIFSFEPLIALRDYRKKLGNIRAVNSLYNTQITPFVNYIYQNSVPEKIQHTIAELKECSEQYSYLIMQDRSKELKKTLYEKNMIPSLEKSFTQQVCRKYLNDSIDHILVGLRNQRYVDDILPILQNY